MSVDQEKFRANIEERARRARLTSNNRWFFGYWGNKHVGQMPGYTFIDYHPAQHLDHFKSPAARPSVELPMTAIIGQIYGLIEASFQKRENALKFMQALKQPYPHQGGEGRSYIRFAAEEYQMRGHSIVPLMWHADDGLTDVPRFTGLARANLGELYLARDTLGMPYDEELFNSVGEVASRTVTFEAMPGGYAGADVLPILGDVNYTGPQTTSANEIRKEIGMTKKEYDELLDYINGGSAPTIVQDIRDKHVGSEGDKIEPGQIKVMSPAGKRAEREEDSSGNIISLTTGEVIINTARIIGHARAIWPVGILSEQIVLGPIIPLAEIADLRKSGLNKEQRNLYRLREVEDGMELCGELLDRIIGKSGVAKFRRTTERGKIHAKYSREAPELGNLALRSTI